MKRELTLGFSPCPNDTFIFHALVSGLVGLPEISFRERLEDVETLNLLALAGELDVTKVSCHLLGHIRGEYIMLAAGAALGRGCGPLLVSREDIPPASLRGKPIAVPGRYTTAALLLRLFDPSLENLVYLPFHEIMPALVRGDVAAGVIIHESRFTFTEYGLTKLVDLGEWWERDSGHPIPLGGIVARRSLGAETILRISDAIRDSIDYARANPAVAGEYIRSHAQEMSDEVCSAHIGLYVNEFSRNLGEEGRLAIGVLLDRAEKAGIIPPCSLDVFVG
ncbi:MAG TPA: 1,4-dihydroxy-6-naphthoate synthase [Geobacteraceae bacterium]|nr:1,4-dihydroxy-6-naphthoate synthase [Geobacteraceae bacterium]